MGQNRQGIGEAARKLIVVEMKCVNMQQLSHDRGDSPGQRVFAQYQGKQEILPSSNGIGYRTNQSRIFGHVNVLQLSQQPDFRRKRSLEDPLAGQVEGRSFRVRTIV